MASYSVNLLHSRPRKDGKKQVVVNISARGTAFVHTKVYVDDSEWDVQNRCVVGTNARVANSTISLFTGRVQQVFNVLFVQGRIKAVTAKEIKQIVLDGGSLGVVESNNCTGVLAKNSEEDKGELFFDFADRVLARINKPKTLEVYTATKQKIRQFCESQDYANDANELTFGDIDVAFVKNFESYMEKNKLSVNTRSLHLRNLRKIYNDAIDENEASAEAYPFRKFKIKTEKTKHRNLEIDELILLRDFACTKGQKQYVDMFFLGFYLIGINMADLCSLTEITKNGRVEYRRSKTSNPLSIKVEPEALKIIEKYRGKNYLINVSERWSDYSNYLRKLNKNLKEIGSNKKTKQKALFPELSWYYARHTWATIAADLDIPDDTIEMALGHEKDRKKSVIIYIKRNQKKIDDANRKVIDYINNYKKTAV